MILSNLLTYNCNYLFIDILKIFNIELKNCEYVRYLCSIYFESLTEIKA